MRGFPSLAQLPPERSVRQLQLVAARLVGGLLAGNYRSAFRGVGIEFDEVREYVEGDDARLIDWNVSSRAGQIYTKTFREERELTLFAVLDASASLQFGSGSRSKAEVALISAALLTLAAVTNNDKVGGLLFSDRVEAWLQPAKGRRHAARLLQQIMATKPRGSGSDLAAALRLVNETLKRRSLVVIVSDFLMRGYQRELALLAKRHDVVAIRVNDPIEAQLPRVALARVRDPETGRTGYISGRSRRFRFAYEQFWVSERRHWSRECRRRGIRALEIDDDERVAEQLVRFFRHSAGRSRR